MPSFIYAPAIEVHVETTHGIIDISEDVTAWQCNRRENAVSTFSFTLQNTQRKYDGRLLPMDRISVRMKRIAWVQVFTGYLNDGPIFQAWPGELNITASCSLKRLQFWYWDPGTSEVTALLNKVTTGAVDANSTNQESSTLGDRGQSTMIRQIISTVTQGTWPEQHIHIGEIPADWFKWASSTIDLIDKDTADYQRMGNFAIGGSAFAPGQVIAPGSYGGTSFTAKQVGWAALIYQTIVFDRHLPNWIVTLALMCSITECGLQNIASANVPASQTITHDQYSGNPTDGLGHDHGSVGLFQQQTGSRWVPAGSGLAMNQTTMGTPDGWGTPAELLDAPTATTRFLDGVPSSGIRGLLSYLQKDGSGQYIDVVSRGASAASDPIQSVQGSGPDAYAGAYDPAKALTKALDAAAKTGQTTDKGELGIMGIGSNPTGATGSQLAAMAMALINAHTAPAGKPIVYDQSGCDAQKTAIESVSTLDCSALTGWCYYHTTNKPFPGTSENDRGPFSGDQWAACTRVDYDIAVKIQGAFLFGGVNGSEHVGISLGNGQHVAAHDHYPDPAQDCTIDSCVPSSNFHPSPVSGGLAPGIDYSGSGTDAASMAFLKKLYPHKTISKAPKISATDAPSVTTAGADPGAPGNDEFKALLSTLVRGGVPDSVSMTLTGRLAVMNDQPFLPWIETLVQSTMRSFCSAPNGDFIAWWPDYFNIWGKAGIIKIQPIELQNFDVSWSDQDIVTHQFVLGNTGTNAILDQATGSVSPTGTTELVALATSTAGIATMDYAEIFQAIYGQQASSQFIKAFLERFGARPQVDQIPNIQGGEHQSVFFMALYLFVQRWAGQFSAQVPVTFMPEVYPGMIIQIPEYGFQAYVTDVSHSGTYGPGGGFTTTITVVAPASTVSDRSDLLSLLPNVSSPLHGPDISKTPPAKNHPQPPGSTGGGGRYKMAAG